jgi:hypothetical protein
VVEAYIGSDPRNPNRYAEFQVAPSNEKLDLMLNLPERDFAWSSGFESAVRVDRAARRWTCEMRIPMKSLAAAAPQAGASWRLHFFRCDRAQKAFLAWSPTWPESDGVRSQRATRGGATLTMTALAWLRIAT